MLMAKGCNMLNNKDYCDYDTCVALKELGYIGQGRLYYAPDKDPNELKHFGIQVLTTRSAEALNFVLAVHLFDAQKWLREEKRICVEVDCCAGGYVWELCKAYHKDWFSGGTTIYTHCCEDNAINPLLNDCGKYDSYEEALLEGIKEAVKILVED